MDHSCMRKLDGTIKRITKKLEEEERKQREITDELSDATGKYEGLRETRIAKELRLEEYEQLLDRFTGCTTQREIQSLHREIKGIHHQLGHGCTNLTEQNRLFRLVIQLESARAKAVEKEKERPQALEKERAADQELKYCLPWRWNKKALESCVEYYVPDINKKRSEEYMQWCIVHRLEKEKNIIDKHICFLKRRLESTCRLSQGRSKMQENLGAVKKRT